MLNRYLCLIALASAPLLVSAQEDAIPVPDLSDTEIINASYNFRKNVEPDMTEAEYALYEQVVPMAVSRPDFALTLLETMVADEEEESPAFLFVLGNVYYSANELEKAEKYYRMAVEAYPDFLRAWANLGVLYYTSQRFEEAVECTVKAIDLGDRSAESYELLGYCLEQSDNLLASEMAYMQAYIQEPNNSKYVKALVFIYLETKQYERAEPMLRQLLKLDPEDESNWALFARMLNKQERRLEAMSVLETAQQLGITTPMEDAQLADLYADLNFQDEAVEAYRKVIEDDEKLGYGSYIRYVKSAVASEDYETARALLKDLPRNLSEEHSMEVLLLVAEINFNLGEYDQARSELETVLETDPMNGKALLILGRALVQQQEIARAEFVLEQACQVEEFIFPASIELAALYVESRRYSDALEYLDKALKVRSTPELEQYRVSLLAVAKNG